MKKILQITMFLASILLCFSCKTAVDDGKNDDDSGSGKKETLLDLRNKTADGKSYRSIDGNYTFSYEYIEKTDNKDIFSYYYGPGSDWENDFIPLEWVKNTITLADCEDGVKITFHTPDEKDCPVSNVDWLNVVYVDGNGNGSTTVTLPNNLKDAFNQGTDKTFDIVFPLVLPGETVTLYVNYGYVTKDYYNDWNPDKSRVIRLCYKVNTAHGKAKPDDLPKDFDVSKYVTIKEDGKTFEAKGIIPPEGKEVKKAIQLWECNDKGESNQLFWPALETSEGRTFEKDGTDDFSIDLTAIDVKKIEAAPGKNYPYIYVQFYYEYRLEEYPNLVFRSPVCQTYVVDNTQFRGTQIDYLIKYSSVVKVSDTEYKATSADFRDLLKALVGHGTNFKLTVTDKTLPKNFFSSLCWDDIKIDYTYTLDLSETEIEVIPGWNTGESLYGGENSNAPKITSVILPNTITKLDDGAFSGTSIESINVPASCKWIGIGLLPESSYTNCWTKKIIIPEADYSNWKALDGGDDKDGTREISVEKWNNRVTEGTYNLDSEGFYQWRRYFKVD